MEPDSIISDGTAHIIIPDPGHGDLISDIHLISDGALVGDIARVGLVLDLVMGMDMAGMVTVIRDADGGDQLVITRLAGVGGTEAQDPMAFTEIIFMCIITYT